MKKSLILLPLAGLFLASCNSNGELPSGGNIINPSNEESVTDFATRFADCIESTVVASKNGVKISAVAKIEELSFKMDGKAEVNINDAEFTFDLAADFLDKESVNDWKVAADFKAKGDVKISLVESTINLDLNLDDLAINAFLSEGNFYLDLTNEKLGSIIDTVVNQVAGPVLKPVFDSIIKDILVKNKIAGISELIGDMKLPSNVISSKVKTDIIEIVNELIKEVANDEVLKDLINFVLYDDGRLGFSYVSGKDSIFGDENYDVKEDLKGSILFDKNGKFAKISEAGELTANSKAESAEKVNLNAKVESEITAEYGVSIEMPNFSDYVDSKIPELIEMLLQTFFSNYDNPSAFPVI